ncbi:MAG TPA: amidohydrolase family protein [Bryobacteraceae bacterium]|nr:amidohydrolase family protein [Bryobacteraceae bacterium]
MIFSSLIALALVLVPLPHPFSHKENALVLQDVKLIDGTNGPEFDHASILIVNGKIANVVVDNANGHWPKGAQFLKLPGKTVIPGIINAHGHLGLTQGATVSIANYTEENVERQLTQYQRYGVTTVMSLGMNLDLLYKLRAEQSKGKLDGATILTAGRGIGAPDGVPAPGLHENPVYRPKTPGEARKDVREMARHHPDLIKIWVDDNLGKLPRPDPAVYGAAIEQAHELNLRVAAHVYTLESADRLLEDHIDILAHSIRNKLLDDRTVDLITKQGVFYIPSLQMEEAFYIYAEHPKWMDTPFFKNALSPALAALLDSQSYIDSVKNSPEIKVHRKALEIAMKNLSTLLDAGANIGFGTDSGANPFRIQGFAEHRELELMVQAGMTPLQAIQSATGVNARLLGIDKTTGTLVPGKDADFIVLDADPMEDIRNTEKIDMIFHRGKRFDQGRTTATQ